MEANQIQLQGLIDKSAEKVNYEANLVLLAEAQKNLTDYNTLMNPQIAAIQTQIETYTYYYRNATKAHKDFDAYISEIEGYMTITLGFLWASNSIETDLNQDTNWLNQPGGTPPY